MDVPCTFSFLSCILCAYNVGEVWIVNTVLCRSILMDSTMTPTVSFGHCLKCTVFIMCLLLVKFTDPHVPVMLSFKYLLVLDPVHTFICSL